MKPETRDHLIDEEYNVAFSNGDLDSFIILRRSILSFISYLASV